jgi:hypothetical protein
MSIYVNVKSACGRSSASVDIFDLELNQDGIICCDACESIINTRESWYTVFNFDTITWQSK